MTTVDKCLKRVHSSSVSHRFLILISFLAVYILWGSTYLAMHVLMHNGFTPFLGAAFRMIIAGSVMYAIAHIARHAKPTRAEWKHLAISGVLYLLGGNGLTMVASQYLPSGVLALLSATTPFFLTAGAALLPPRELPSSIGWLGTLCGFCGVAVFVSSGPMRTEGDSLLGIIAMLAAALFWASAALWSKRHLRHLPSSVTSAWQMLIGSGALLIVGLARQEQNTFAPTANAWPAFAFLIVCGSLIGYNAFVFLMKTVPAAKVATYSYVNPVVAMALGWWWLGEELNVRQLVGAAVILVGVVLVNAGTIKRA